jgi:ankyrin repeat protein
MNDCRAQLRPRSPGTCEWISSNNQLREWILDEHSSLLCITGDMGSGKSILTSYLVEQMKTILAVTTQTGSTTVVVCSFFCDDKDVGRNHGQAILRGLLYQILTQRHDLMEHAIARFSEVVPERWSILVLWEILRDIMLNPKTGTIVLIIDAIDECEPCSRDRLLAAIKQFLIQKLEPPSTVLKLLMSSRNNVDITEEIEECSKIICLEDAAEVRGVEQDMKLVVKDQLDALAIKAKWPEETRQSLERRIVMKADRNFLWVSLVIQRLKGGPQTKKYFEKVIEESPRDLDGLYCRILADIETENQALAAKILRILVGSFRPLATAEIQIALAIDLDHLTLRSVEEDSDMAVERTIRLVLGPLVRIHDFQVHFVHQSAKEFLLRLASGKVADLSSFELDLRKLYGTSLNSAHLELATACVEFLGLADFEERKVLDENVPAFLELPGATEESPWSMDQKPPFFEYSASHWTRHLCGLGVSTPHHLLESSIRISRSGTNCLSNWSDQYRLSSKDYVTLPKDLDPLIVAAFFGLVLLANKVLEKYPSELQDKSKSLALSWACRMGHADIAKLLLDHGTPVTGAWVEGGSPISWACVGGHLEIVKLLLDEASSSQVNILDGNGRSPLSLAVGSGDLPIAKLLIAREDVDVNITDRTGSSPLLWAIGSKCEPKDLMVLKCLVSEPRVNIAQRDRYGRSVLSWAAEMGALDAVNILLQSSRPDIQSLLDDPGDTDRGWSPLSWAAYSGRCEVVKALCMTGRIDVQLASVDKRGQNAVSLAADRSHGEVIKVLAQFYPQGVDCPEESGRTPLSCAMWGSLSNVETVRILIQTGLVDVNRKALNGRTPLSYAAAVGRSDLVRILVEEGDADLDIPDNDGNAPGELYIDWRSSQAREEIDRLRRLRSKPGPT